jgi:hypothetical protein
MPSVNELPVEELALALTEGAVGIFPAARTPLVLANQHATVNRQIKPFGTGILPAESSSGT